MDDGERLARAALRYGGAYVIAFVDRVLVGLLEEALAALPTDDSPLRAELLARLGAALQPALDPEHPNTLAREAIAMARRVQTDDRTLLSILVAGTSALSYFGDPSERLPLDTELITLATRQGDRISTKFAQDPWPTRAQARRRASNARARNTRLSAAQPEQLLLPA